MYCPNCGTKVSGEQKFCRSCGLRLEKVHQLLGEELSTAELYAKNKIRRFEHWRNVAGLSTAAAFILTVLGVFIYQIATNLRTDSPDFYAALVSLVLLLGIAVALSFAGYSAYLRQRLANRSRPPALAPPDGVQTLKLAPDAPVVELPSVTEHTTEMLETNPREGGRHADQSSPAARIRSGDGTHAQDA